MLIDHMKKKDKQIEQLAEQNRELHVRVLSLENANQSMKAMVEWLSEVNNHEKGNVQTEKDSCESFKESTMKAIANGDDDVNMESFKRSNSPRGSVCDNGAGALAHQPGASI